MLVVRMHCHICICPYPHDVQGRIEAFKSNLQPHGVMNLHGHYLGVEDPFEWTEEQEEKQEGFEELFKLQDQIIAKPELEPVERYLRSHSDDANMDVQQLRDEIVSRQRLMDRQIEELDNQISRASFSLKQLDFRVGYNAAVDFKRNWTERELANFRRERRNLRVRCWEDIVALRKQLREAMKQYKDARTRRELMERGDDGS